MLARVHGVREDVDRPSVRRLIRELGEREIDRERPGDWNQALMDLGATICVPGTPDCARCPLQAQCDAYAQGDADQLPIRAAARPPVPVDVGVGLVIADGRVLTIKRDAALLKGLWVFLLSEGDSTPEGMARKLETLGMQANRITPLGEARHVFTHRIWNMQLYRVDLSAVPKRMIGQWADAQTLTELPLPTAMKAARRAAMDILLKE